jgi:heat shock protein HslJ
MNRLVIVLIAAAVAVTACGTETDLADPGPPPDTTAVERVAGESEAGQRQGSFDGDWLAIEGAVDGEPVELPAVWPIKLTVQGAHVDGVAVCNEFGAELEFSDDLVTVVEAHINEAGCEPAEVHVLEDLFFDSFVRLSNWKIDGDTLTISNATDAWTFEPLRPIDASQLEGVRWQLESVEVGDGAVALPDAVDATLLLGDNGVYEVRTGCGRLDGHWGTSGRLLGLNESGHSLESCSTEGGELHQLLASALSGRVEAGLDGGDLVVRAGRTTLVYRRTEGGPTSPPPIPEATVSPVRHGGGDPAGQVIGPVMLARQCAECDQEAAIIAGALVLDGECLYLDHADFGMFTPLWPFGTQWQPEPAAVVLPDGSVIAVGAQFEGGGGYHDITGLAPFTIVREVLERAASCVLDDAPEVAVVQSY